MSSRNPTILPSYQSTKTGFTLIEMIIVMAIIMILLGIAMFPYGYYMQRSYTERASDGFAQEWVLSHKAIRSWIEFDPLLRNHAHLFFVFQKWKSEIESYLLSGTTLPDLNSLPTDPHIIRKYKTFTMEDGVQILNFTGSLINIWNTVWYMISPPFGDGEFFTGSITPGMHTTWARIIVGYPGSTPGTGRSREILLRTYLK